jgi:acetyl/propionyl-CoA carboxylase alpha subunit
VTVVHPSGVSPYSDPPAPSPGRRRSITRLLVANRGEIARRIFRTAREMGIATVAVFTEADRDALFPGEADQALALDRLSDRGPGAYLDAPALVEAARRAGADAVHPGYGFLAEDASFAWRCAEAGLLYVGPSPEAIATMGSKLEAKAVAAAAGVPVLTAEEVDGYPPGKLEAAAEVLGWPVLVKASAGGGGRGMRVVREGDDLVGAVEAARREATNAFGDGTVFLEPWLESPRHVEVQVFGDATGRVVHLFERDCSLQRRHQKVIEEAPAPRLPQPLRERLHAAAIAVAEAVDYVGAGTAEFLVAGDDFWFLEMNTRLQVEHPVTEAILGLDLVRMQLAAAEGRPLPVEARHCSPSGHAVEARLYAEDPAAGYLPQAGRLRRFEIDPAPGLRVEAGVASGSVVGSDYDPMLAKVVAHAATRAEAIRRLAAALEGMRIHGLRTNRDQLVAALRHPEFVAGDVDTGLLERHHDRLCAPRGGAEAVRLHAVAAALAGMAGRRNNPSQLQEAAFAGPAGQRIAVGYRVDLEGGVGGVEVDGTALAGLRLGAVAPDAVDLEVDGVRRQVTVSASGPVVDVDSVLGHTELVVLEPS